MTITYRKRTETLGVMLHASHTPANMSYDLEHFLAVKGRAMGLLNIGYHAVILMDGRLIETRPHDCIGVHCRGLDRKYIGVCLAGGVERALTCDCVADNQPCHEDCLADTPADNFTAAQGETLGLYMDFLRSRYPEPLPIVGHSEVRPGHPHQCPPCNMDGVRKWTDFARP